MFKTDFKSFFFTICILVFVGLLFSDSRALEKLVAFSKDTATKNSETKGEVITKMVHESKRILPTGKQIYHIIVSHFSPQIYEATVDPVDVYVGQKQAMTLRVRDKEHPIVSVSAFVETDTGVERHNLSLLEGTASDGVWSGFWEVKDTHNETYRTIFKAENANNEAASVTVGWTDPTCNPVVSGDWTLSEACNTGATVTGADNGNINLNNFTLIVDAGGVLVWNINKNINIGTGNLVINNTGESRETNLWMVDSDADNHPASATQYAQDSASASQRRRYLMHATTVGQFTAGAELDCWDSDANAQPHQTGYFTVARSGDTGALRFDYNCNSVIEKQYGTLSTASFGCVSQVGVIPPDGWFSSVPDCGINGTWRYQIVDSACNVGYAGRQIKFVDMILTQGCR